jgi:hyperosmotically inducible periplasmic protein
MRHTIRSGVAMALIGLAMVGCASTRDTSSTASGSRTVGQTVDDAKITTMVKTELAKEKMSTLTKIDVDTNRGTVYLNGTVQSDAMRMRATEIARNVSGVRDVVNNLRVQ